MTDLGISDFAEEAKPAPAPQADPGGLGDFADEVQASAPSLSERGRTVSQGAVGAVVESTPIVAGAIAGGKVGAALGAFGGPAAPVTVPLGAGLGALGGGVAGMMFGKQVREYAAEVDDPVTGEPLTFDNIESVPPRLRPYAVGGEVLGGSVGFATGPYALVRNGITFAPNLAGRMINRITATAGAFPVQFALAEASAAVGAAVGGGVAEAQFPGETLPRVSFEIIGGLTNPTRWVIAGSRKAFGTIRTSIQSMTPGGRANRASEILRQVLTDAGEDPAAVAAALRARKDEIAGLNLTSGQTSGSPALLRIEATLARESAQFGQESRRMAEDGLSSMRQMMDLLSASGDPQALRAAATVRDDYFKSLMATRLHVAEQRVLAAAAAIDPDNPASRAEFGRQASEIMTGALSDVRAAERELWGRVGRETPAGADGIIGAYNAIRGERLPEESLPGIVEGFVRRMRGEGDEIPDETRRLIEDTFGPGAAGDAELPTTTGELMRFRSRMLELTRESAAKNEYSDARVYGQLAEAALDDLDGAMVDDASAEAYDAARTFSRELHDTFSRTFAGDALESSRSGAPRIPPELVMVKAFASGREVGEMQFRQLEAAARMAGTEHVSRLIDVQERTLRAAAGEIVDPTTGGINANRLARFRSNNAELLQRFPELDRQLADAQTAERFLGNTRTATARAQKAIQNQAVFSRLVANEDPVTVIGRSLRGATPQSDFGQLVRLAKASGPEAVDGLESSLFSYVYERAGGSRNFSFSAYREALEKPIRPGAPSLKDMMRQNGMIDDRKLDLMTRMFDRAAEIEKALRGELPLEGVLSAGDAMLDMVLRIAGSSAATMTPTGAAHPLIVGGAGSRYARQVFDKIPQSRVRTVLMDAAKDPEFMAMLLERPSSQKAKVSLALQLNAYAWQAGVFSMDDQ